jgi:TLC domain
MFGALLVTLFAVNAFAALLLGLSRRYLAWSYVVSALHALYVGPYALWLLLTTSARYHCIAPIEGGDWTLIEVMGAYLLADTLCVALWLSPREIIAHHVTSLVSLGIAHAFGIGYGVVLRFAMTELSTLPLNACWLLKPEADGPPPSPTRTRALSYAGALLVLVYFATRVATIPEMLLVCYPQIWHQLPRWIGVPSVVALAYMMGMNVVWFWKICRRVYAATRPTEREHLP